jgi:probable HAF family extracellular repeat protein
MRLKNVLLVFIFLCSNVLLASSQYRLHDLGTLPEGTYSVAEAINEHGAVVGYSSTVSNEVHAFLHQNGEMIDLGTLGGKKSKAKGINNNGVIVGQSLFSEEFIYHGFIYENGQITDLGTLGGGKWCMAYDINDSNDVVGSSWNVDDKLNAFLYRNGNMINLGVLDGSQSTAIAINEKGQVAGRSSYSTDHLDMHGFLYDVNGMIDIDPNGNESYCFDINIKGEITGWRRHTNTVSVPFIYSQGVMTEFETLGGKSGFGIAINDFGQIVGESRTVDGDRRAFLYDNGQVIDLNELIEPNDLTLIMAKDINNKGQIVGICTSTQGDTHAFLLNPIEDDETTPYGKVIR